VRTFDRRTRDREGRGAQVVFDRSTSSPARNTGAAAPCGLSFVDPIPIQAELFLEAADAIPQMLAGGRPPLQDAHPAARHRSNAEPEQWAAGCSSSATGRSRDVRLREELYASERSTCPALETLPRERRTIVIFTAPLEPATASCGHGCAGSGSCETVVSPGGRARRQTARWTTAGADASRRAVPGFFLLYLAQVRGFPAGAQAE